MLAPTPPEAVEETTRVQPARFSKRLQRYWGNLLETMAQQLGYSWDSVGLVIPEGAIDPNVRRYALGQRMAHETVDLNLNNDGELATIRSG